MTIFDLMTSRELAAYWLVLSQDEPPYPTEELFPVKKKRGLSLKWLKGATGLPIVLKTSAFDAAAIPRERIGIAELSMEMPFFKESKYIDEELRQELNIVLETGNQAYIDAIMDRIFDDQIDLLRGARASRERMRMMVLTTGTITMANNGQSFTYDYQIPEDHKGEVTVSWSSTSTADPIEDMRAACQKIYDDTGVWPTRAMCDQQTYNYIRNNQKIRLGIYVLTSGAGPTLTSSQVDAFIADQLDGLRLKVNSKRYRNEAKQTVPFMPSNTIVFFPEGPLGNTWFGTTPAESDLMTSSIANVSIVDTGVAITTAKKVDPVQVETIVSMICLPSFEEADKIYILDTAAS